MSRNSMMARGWLTVTVVAVIALVIATKTGSANDSNGDGAKAETLVRMVSELRLKLRKLPEAERCETFTKNVVMQAREAHLIGDNDKRGDEENEWAHYKRIIELIQGRLGCFGRSSPSITSRLCSLVSFMNDCADYIRNPDFVEPQPAPSGEVKATGSIPDTESLQREILAMKSKNQELLEQLGQNKQELLAKDELIQQVRDEMSAMKSKLDQTIAATKDQLSQTSEELKAKESVNQQINSELASLQSKLNEKDKELVAAKDVLVEQVRKEKAGQQQLKLDQTTSDQLKQASQELAAKDKRIEQLNSELARLQSKLDQKNGDHLMEKGRLAQQVRDEMNDVQLKLIKKIAATNQELTKKTEELSIKERLLKQAEFDKSQLQLQLANKISLNNANVSELKNCRTSLMEVDKLKRENYKLQRTIDEWIIVNKEQKKQLDLKKHELNQSLEGNRKCLNFMEELRLDYYMRTGREYNISSLLRYLQ